MTSIQRDVRASMEAALDANPTDMVARSAYADWLEEQGETAEAELVKKWPRRSDSGCWHEWWYWPPEKWRYGRTVEYGLTEDVYRFLRGRNGLQATNDLYRFEQYRSEANALRDLDRVRRRLRKMQQVKD